jgi:hypothetical protein
MATSVRLVVLVVVVLLCIPTSITQLETGSDSVLTPFLATSDAVQRVQASSRLKSDDTDDPTDDQNDDGVSATGCLQWACAGEGGANTAAWVPGMQDGKPVGVCRAVSLDSTPLGVDVGKSEATTCYYTATSPTRGGPRAQQNGTTTSGAEFATVSPQCTVSFSTVGSDWPKAVPRSAVVAGFHSTGATLGVCLAPNGEGAGSMIPGQAYLSGPRRGQCCWNSGFIEHCMSDDFQLATFIMVKLPPRPKIANMGSVDVGNICEQTPVIVDGEMWRFENV